MTATSYRLSTQTGNIANGPLALVVPQAVALARKGQPATITDPTSRSYEIHQRPDGLLVIDELTPAELFPSFDPEQPARWITRAQQLHPDLNAHTT